MSKILNYARDAEVVDGKANEILSITKAEVYAVNWVDKTGQKQTLLAMVFGKLKDGGPGVFIMAEAEEVKTQLRMPSSVFLKQFRAQLSATEPVDSEALPTTIGIDEDA